MANLGDNIGEALEAAFKAATWGAGLGNTASVLHVEYGVQPVENVAGASGRCFIRLSGYEQERQFAASALGVWRFQTVFDIVDVMGKDRALTLVQQGLANALSDRGLAVLNTHLSDAGSNRLGKSGEITYTLSVQEPEQDVDRPMIVAEIAVRLWHAVPLA